MAGSAWTLSHRHREQSRSTPNELRAQYSLSPVHLTGSTRVTAQLAVGPAGWNRIR
jgi:hypothetical protein